MASLLFGAIALTYSTVAKSVRRRRAAKSERDARFAELEHDNAVRIARLRAERCDCGGDHAAADHPGGPQMPGEVDDDTVIRNDAGDGSGVYTRGTEEGPPAYDDVLASGRGPERREWDERYGYVR
ncbi:hypothetical protein MMC07_000038 [Pseudocyphellaria aurata]|nr:hypothetical protein [Pseudocyphellaria aurata]